MRSIRRFCGAEASLELVHKDIAARGSEDGADFCWVSSRTALNDDSFGELGVNDDEFTSDQRWFTGRCTSWLL